jgi:hypothetical protein
MAPTINGRAAKMLHLTSRAAMVATPEAVRLSAHVLAKRGLAVTDTQKVTLGVIGAYVVVIALLWNLPYVKWVLWPFKVRPLTYL